MAADRGKARLRVVIADDHTAVRAGLRDLLEAQDDFEVVAETDDGPAAIEAARRERADLVILDLSMPNGSGLSVLPELRKATPGVRVVVLTMYDDPVYLKAALSAGAMGYVLKSSMPEQVLRALRQVARGKRFLDPVLRATAGGS